MKREIIPYNSERRPYAQHLRLSGQYEDSESGLHYNTFRYYDPEMGRYLSRDPIGERDTSAALLHPYAFCENSPLVFSDPDGRFPWEEPYISYPQPEKGKPNFPKAGIWMCEEELWLGVAIGRLHHRFIVVDGIGIGYEKAKGSWFYADPGGIRIENDLKPRRDVSCYELKCLVKDCAVDILGEMMAEAGSTLYQLGYRDCQSWANMFARRAYAVCEEECCKEQKPRRSYAKCTGW
jgi:RHS repeat-associated protein